MYDDFLSPTEEDALQMQQEFEKRTSICEEAYALVVLYRFLACRVLSKRQRRFFIRKADSLSEKFPLPEKFGLKEACAFFPQKKTPNSLRLGVYNAIWLEVVLVKKFLISDIAFALERLDVISHLSS